MAAALFTSEHLTSWLALADGSAELALAARWSSFVLRLASDGQTVAEVRVSQGKVKPLDGPAEPEETITLSAPASVWEAFCALAPTRHRHHVLALDKDVPDFQVDRRDLFIRHLRVVDLVLQPLRDALSSIERSPR
jgi:hypothetical protein